jgi:hypothetical protein
MQTWFSGKQFSFPSGGPEVRAAVADPSTGFAPGLAGFPTRLSHPIAICFGQGRVKSFQLSRASRESDLPKSMQ